MFNYVCCILKMLIAALSALAYKSFNAALSLFTVLK